MGRMTTFFALSAVLAALFATPAQAADPGGAQAAQDRQWQEIFAAAPSPTMGVRVTVRRTTRTDGDDPGTNGTCFGQTFRQENHSWWGYWVHWHHTTWCGNRYGAISYRYTEPHAAAGSLCERSWGPDVWRTAGGVGYPEVRVRMQTGFSCYGGAYHGSPWFEIAFTASGGSWVSGQGGTY